MTSRFASYSLLAALVITAAGCAAPSLTSPSTSASKPRASSDESAATGGKSAPAKGAGSVGGAVSDNAGGMVSNNGGPLTGNGAGAAGAPGAAASTTPSASGDMASEGASAPMNPGVAVGEPNPSSPAQPPTQEALKAGSVDDNAKFADYLAYLADFDWEDVNAVAKPRKLDVTDRHVIRVVDAAGKGVANATVAIKAGEVTIAEATTYADGRTLFHPRAYQGISDAASFTVAVTKGALTASEAFDADEEAEWQVDLAAAVEKPAVKLDMAICLDTTGSMGGEIQKFQTTISSIASRVQALPGQPAVRFGLVAYKDQKEQYVSKVFSPFTADVPGFQTALNQLTPGGGGDKPEDLEAGLADTVNTLAWDADAVRLSFVVTDAATHTNYEQSPPYTDTMQLASKKGIKLYAIGASSLEAEGEYALRQFAQWTMGQYLFVTRGGDEATGGGGTASATVDKFREGRLDDIVVDIVKAELAKLGE